jgi:hypothetical protein
VVVIVVVAVVSVVVVESGRRVMFGVALFDFVGPFLAGGSFRIEVFIRMLLIG